MKQVNVPVYHDPESFEELAGQAKFPCTTERMKYDALTRRYYLTLTALEDYGIDVDGGYVSECNKKVDIFIDEVTDDLYGVILHVAKFNYEYNSYLIAQGLSRQFPDRYTARKQFEKALLYQAHYKLTTLDPRDLSGVDPETGNAIYHKQLRKELRHISPKALDILEGLGLLFNGRIPGKELINYSEVM